MPAGSISDTSLSAGFVDRIENLSALQDSVPFDSFDNEDKTGVIEGLTLFQLDEENNALLGDDSSIFDGLSVISE